MWPLKILETEISIHIVLLTFSDELLQYVTYATKCPFSEIVNTAPGRVCGFEESNK